MTKLPRFVRLAPQLFYVAAALVLAFSIALPLIELNRFGYSSQLPTEQGYMRSAVLNLIIREAVESLYLLANGLILHVLIAILEKLPAQGGEGSE